MGGQMITKLIITEPSDLHVHFREGTGLSAVVPYTAKNCAYGLPMPNTEFPPIWNGPLAMEYRGKIMEAIPQDRTGEFQPVMCIKVYDGGEKKTTPEIVREAKALGVRAMKIYPVGVTTNSHDGVSNFKKIMPAIAAAEEVGMILCIHGESPDQKIDVLYREKAFLETLRFLASEFPKLRIVLEHVTTEDAVDCVKDLPANVAATITAHHLAFTMNDWAGGYLKPDLFCKPIIKLNRDRAALRDAATSGNPKFFFGSDSAPHPGNKKYCHEGCAGVFTAPIAFELVAEIFEEMNAFENFEKFVSLNGPAFYKLPITHRKIGFLKKEWVSAVENYQFGDKKPIPSAFYKRKFSWQIVPSYKLHKYFEELPKTNLKDFIESPSFGAEPKPE